MKRLPRLLFLLAACLPALAAVAARADPPGRIGRISLVGGAVFLYNDQYGEQQAAKLNWPVTSGDTLTTAAGARAEVRVGSTAIRMDGDSQLEFAALDDQQLRLRLLRGTVAVKMRDIEQARQFLLNTPQGSVALNDVGAYRFEAGLRPGGTAVAVFQGAAAFTGAGLTLGVGAGQQAAIFGEANLGYAVTAAVQGDFDLWSLARDRRDDEVRSVRYVSREMTGYEELDGYGDWREVADYGPVWYPRRVVAGWAPYRSGHWAWVQPWGWTWIDEAPWGFAPFHYGRWAHIGGIWGWVPGPRVARPVYAPALVAWVGRPGWQIAFSVGIGPAVGWFPLAPREVFVPAFPASAVYVQRVNAPHVRSLAQIENAQRDPQRVQYVHRAQRDAVTIVPSNVVSSGAAVSRHAYRLAQGQSIGTLPAAVVAPALASPPRRERAAAPASAPQMSQERAASPRGVAPATAESRPVAPQQRQADMPPAAPPAAPREARAAATPPSVSADGVPGDALLGAARTREAGRTAPPSRHREPVAPAQASSPRIERETQRPAAEPRRPAPATTQDAASPHGRGAMRDAGPSPRASEPQRDERKGGGTRERREDRKDRGPEGREGGRGARP